MLQKSELLILNTKTRYLKHTCIILIFSVLIVLLYPNELKAQDAELVALNKQLIDSKADTTRIYAIIAIAKYFEHTNTDSFLVYARKAYEISKTSNNYKLNETARIVGMAYSSAGDYEKSLKYQIESYNYSLKIKDSGFNCMILNDIGTNYLLLNDFKLALKYFTESYTICQDYERVVSLVNIGQIYSFTERYAEAHESFEKALSMAVKENNSRDISVIYNRLGHLYLLEKSYDNSLCYYGKSLELLDSAQLYYRIDNLKGIAENHLINKNYKMGIKVALLADSLARKGGFVYEREFINKFTSELYESIGDYSNSLHYYKIYSDINDSIFSMERDSRMSFLQTEFDTKRKEVQVEMLKKEAVLNKRLNIIYLIICVLIIIILFYFIKNIRQKNKILVIEKEKDLLEKQKLEYQLHEKHREILTHSMQIYQQKEVLSSIETKLSAILEQKEPTKIKASVKLLNEEVKSSIDLSDDWEQIKLHFEKVHPQFFKALKAEYPELSINELKLCAYTKLKFSNKEISRLLNINSSSVHIARYRLKKKLNMPEEINFDEFILSKI